LSAGLWLQRERPDLSFCILEQRSAYQNDRTWCFWETERQRAELVDHFWGSWLVRGRFGSEIEARSKYPYVHIASGAFYQEALDRLNIAGEQRVRLGVSVEKVEALEKSFHITHSEGSVRSRYVLDSRPNPSHGPGLLQHFLGQHVRTSSPVFHPETCTLMDFSVDQTHGIHFLYVLPFSQTEALVEDTFLSQRPWEKDVYRRNISSYLKTHFGTDAFAVEREEAGAIPMSAFPPKAHPNPRYLYLGTAGGCTKPSSGYAFLFIQRQIGQLDSFFGEAKRPVVRSDFLQALDKIFLSYLIHRPDRVPSLFCELFRKTPPDRFVRFLSETPSGLDVLSVVWAAPKWAFVQEAWRARKWLLRR
jgi:lycopene beta-cyclase